MTPIQPTDVLKYITMIRVNYPDAFTFFNANDMDKYFNTGEETETSALIKSWYAILKDYPKEICNKAVINAIKHFEYGKYPKINDILKEIEKMRVAYEKSDEELWAELTGVLREVSRNRYAYGYTFIDTNGKTQGDNARQRNKDIFERLSPELKAYCSNLSGLIALAELTTDELNYEKGRFLRVMPTIKQRAKTKEETPAQLAVLIQGLSKQFALGCAETKLLQGD